jgi:hypothetical protein
MIIARQTTGGSYVLAEMDGSISRLRFAAFRVIPYHARKHLAIEPESFFKYPGEPDESSGSDDEATESAGKEDKGRVSGEGEESDGETDE